MKKVFYVYISLMMCMFASCQKDEDVIEEPKPEPEKPVIKYAEYETTDDYVDFGVGNFMIATKNLGAKRPEDAGYFFAWGGDRTQGCLFVGYVQVADLHIIL